MFHADKSEFRFDCVVERSRAAPLGGRFAITVALLLAVIALAAVLSPPPAAKPQAGAPIATRAG